MGRTIGILLLSVAAALSASCGSDSGPTPFTLQINSADVVLTAVDRVRIVFTPADLDRRFRAVPDMTHFDGEVFTRVSAAGEFVITLERDFVQSQAEMGVATAAFILRLPLAPTEGDESIGDPTLTVTLIRRDEEIASGQRFIVWPLPAAGQAIVTVTCKRSPVDYGRQCTNNDPLPGSDAGTPPPDGG